MTQAITGPVAPGGRTSHSPFSVAVKGVRGREWRKV